jgi:hypothetical protein
MRSCLKKYCESREESYSRQLATTLVLGPYHVAWSEHRAAVLATKHDFDEGLTY